MGWRPVELGIGDQREPVPGGVLAWGIITENTRVSIPEGGLPPSGMETQP